MLLLCFFFLQCLTMFKKTLTNSFRDNKNRKYFITPTLDLNYSSTSQLFRINLLFFFFWLISMWTYSDFKLCNPRNILLWISVILFSDINKSWIFDAPSNAFGSMPVIWLRRKSNRTKFDKRPNKPSDLMRPNSLSFNNLNWKKWEKKNEKKKIRFKKRDKKFEKKNASETDWYTIVTI